MSTNMNTPKKTLAALGRWRQRLAAAWPLWPLWPRSAGGAGNSPARPAALPAPGAAAGAGANGTWSLAWASRAGPYHLNQDVAGARWLRTAAGSGLALAVADGVSHGAAGDVAAAALVQHWLAGPAPGLDRLAFLLAAEPAVTQALRQHTPEPGAATGAACWLDAHGRGWATRVGDRVGERVGDCQLLQAGPAPGQRWQVQALLPDQTPAQANPPGAGAGAGGAEQPAPMVGCARLGQPEWLAVDLAPGDVLLLASGGLHAALSPADWSQLLQHHLGDAGPPRGARPAGNALAALQSLVNDLLQTALRRGSEDDITVLAARRGPADDNPSATGQPP